MEHKGSSYDYWPEGCLYWSSENRSNPISISIPDSTRNPLIIRHECGFFFVEFEHYLLELQMIS